MIYKDTHIQKKNLNNVLNQNVNMTKRVTLATFAKVL